MKHFSLFKKKAIQINYVSRKTVYLQLTKKENGVGFYRLVSPGYFFKFFNALTGQTQQKLLFSSNEEIAAFCENLPKDEMVTNLFFKQKNVDEPLGPENIEVVVEDFYANKIVLRNFPINHKVPWGVDIEHKTFVLAPL